MGWDVVQIGLRHNLPVHDPFATAQEVAKRMKKNVRLVYENKYEYDIEKNVVSEVKRYELIELGKYEVNNSNDHLQMIVADYQANQILKSVGTDKLRKAAFVDEYAEFLLDDLENPFELYEIEDKEEDFRFMIFKENVNLDVYVDGRWHCWEEAFHLSGQYREWLRDYRIKIYHQAKLFGCNEVIICADQGPTEMIYNNANYTADELMEYVRTFQYLDKTWQNSKKDYWKKHAKHIMFSSVFQNQLNLSDEDFVEVIYDDFSDIDSLRKQ